MARLSMSDIWDKTVAFLRREKGLVFPLGFATFGIALLLLGLAAPLAAAEQAKPGPWMIWMLPGFLLVTLGYLAISAIVLMPNISVREALGVAVARLPVAVMLSFMLIGAMLLLLLIATMIVGVIGAGLGWSMQRAAVASLLVALIPLFWLSTRLIALWPLLVDRGSGAMDTVSGAFAATAGHAGRIAGMLLLAGATYLLITGVAEYVGGSVFILLGRAVGSPDLGQTLSAILVAAVGSILATIWSVFVALLYRRLTGSSNGT
jgi:hypothetical protein